MNVRSECHIPNTSELTNSIFMSVVTNICNICIYPILFEVHTPPIPSFKSQLKHYFIGSLG